MNQPTLTINSYCSEGHQRFEPGLKAEWQRDGKSWSCSFCGSMSVEELQECLKAVPPLSFELNDRRDKVYVNRYPHAGDCPVYCTCGAAQDRHEGERQFKAAWADSWQGGRLTHPFVPDPKARSGCACDVKSGGGPVKFMLYHLHDVPDEADRMVLVNRLNVEVVRSREAFMARLRGGQV